MEIVVLEVKHLNKLIAQFEKEMFELIDIKAFLLAGSEPYDPKYEQGKINGLFTCIQNLKSLIKEEEILIEEPYHKKRLKDTI